MTKKIFDIETKLEKVYHAGAVSGIRITASPQIRNIIWNEFVTEKDTNPSVVHYTGGVPTTITLSPYPGYTMEMVQNLAYAYVVLAQVKNWQDLFGGYSIDLGTSKEFYFGLDSKPDMEIFEEIQNTYLIRKSVANLRRKLGNASGLNYQAIINWYNEAIEAWRRSDKTQQNKIASQMENMEHYYQIALKARRTEIEKEKFLIYLIDSFEHGARMAEDPRSFREAYEFLLKEIGKEESRLLLEVQNFKDFDKIQFEIMNKIRLETPPAPAKK